MGIHNLQPAVLSWLHHHRWALLAAWVLHATILHLLLLAIAVAAFLAGAIPLPGGRCGAYRYFWRAPTAQRAAPATGS